MTVPAHQAAICARMRDLLATGRVHDHHGYDALAMMKLPGPDYYALLRFLHLSLRPKLYVEIGVRDGSSLHLAMPETRCIAIDPLPAGDVVTTMRKNIKLAVSTSDQFFADELNRESVKGFDLAFIDGDHSYGAALADFNNLEAAAGEHSIIAVHDVIPMDERTAQPAGRTLFHTGDAWRLMATIVMDRPDLMAFTVACPPTGLGIIGRFGNRRSVPRDEFPNPPAAFPFDDWEAQCRMLNMTENNGAAVGAAFIDMKSRVAA